MRFEGIIPPMITPFKADGALYEDGIRKIMNFLLERGVKGFFICGTYGTGPAMTVEERKRTAEIVIDGAKGKSKVIVHIGSSNVDAIFDLAKHAEEIGADAVATVPPFYYAYDGETIVNFFKELVSRVDIPVFVYNNPARSGNPITVRLLKRLAEVGVAGMKDSCFDLIKFYEFMVNMTEKSFELIIGTESLLVPAYLAGARACISGLANVFPEIVVKTFNLLREGRYEEAARVQLEMIKLRAVLHQAPTYPSVFEALRLRGVDVGYPKPPFRRLTKDEIKRLEEGLKRLGYL